jgi:uncharacterized protein (DUF1499 family)
VIKTFVILALLAVAGLMLYVRFTPSDPAQWHVDPRAIAKPDRPNHWLIRPEGGDARPPDYALEPAELARIIDAVVLAQPRTVRVAGSVESGHMTYLTRTLLMGYPDYVSIRVLATGTGASLVAFSRSRFGQSDLGANRKRMELWLAAIDTAVRAREDSDG